MPLPRPPQHGRIDAPPARPAEKPFAIEDKAELAACKAELEELGVLFRTLPKIDDGAGCGIDVPLAVRALSPDIRIEPEAKLRCQTVRQLARFVTGTAVPLIRAVHPGDRLVGLSQASAYVCRKRIGDGSDKVSEHARGHAIDIAGFIFESGTVVEIRKRGPEGGSKGGLDGALQRALAAAACLYFTTVLDPTTNAAHENHLHLDIIDRKNGFRVCQ